MPMKKHSLVLNTDDPEQKALYDFVKYARNGKKRNASAYLRMLVDREYQKYKSEGGNTGIKFTIE
ncbi:hypothetical protein QUF79_14490 [Fictibacillus enclensis]|uniref:hypothetical protein n=1 Tax=Fictibacillus enclensis TaxID=1017270 RepID=UPI0025A122C6|nr:hypothetical protein [Fictibacillus enclensis]MDM5199226.1 hypothetical protein [Fictibacillus enclensis]